MSSGPTKAALEARVQELTKERDAWRACGPQDPEAMAIARCIVALDAVESKAKPSYGTKGTVSYERIIQYLATRYGVAWPEVVREVVYVDVDGNEVTR